jgi:hypothetical protein
MDIQKVPSHQMAVLAKYYMKVELNQYIIFQHPVAFEATRFYSWPSLMQLCTFGLCDLRHPVHWISLNVFQMLPVMLTNISTNCIYHQFVKNVGVSQPLLLQLQLVLHVSTQLGHPQATHLL